MSAPSLPPAPAVPPAVREGDRVTTTAVDETKDVLLFLEQQLRHAREGGMPLTQERVAGLAFHLASMLEHLAALAAGLPDNDQGGPTAAAAPSPDDEVARHGLLSFHEELSGGRDRRLVVASFGTHWFVLAGFSGAPLRTYRPHGPFLHHEDATREAIRMHRGATSRGRAMLQLVKS